MNKIQILINQILSVFFFGKGLTFNRSFYPPSASSRWLLNFLNVVPEEVEEVIAADVQRRIFSQRHCEKAVFGEECRVLVRSWLAFFQRAHSIQVMQLQGRGYNLDAQEP